MASQNSNNACAAGFFQLPLRVKNGDSQVLKRSSLELSRMAPTKRLVEGLQLDAAPFRLRSPTESTASSISSANVPDSATIHSMSTLASPVSTSYASSVQEMFLSEAEISRSKNQISHRHHPSSGTCSTFVNEEEDGAVATGYPGFDVKFRQLHVSRPVTDMYRMPEPVQLVKNEGEDENLSDAAAPETPGTENATQDWENDSTTTTSEGLSNDDENSILNYTLQLIYGMDLREASMSPRIARTLVSNFVRDIGQNLCQANADSQLTQSLFVSSSSSSPSQGSSGDNSNGSKRKKPIRGGDEDGNDLSDGEGGPNVTSTKRPRPNPKDEENLRLSCPFRKRNPHRFNVRDHHSCAMTYFPKFAELRKHIVKQHKREDPSAFVCDRCNRNFVARKELRDHQRLPKEFMCEIADHDPECGIDGPTATKLLSRKRASGTSAQVQWNEIWHILFPDDEDYDVVPFEFTPVIEHFELSAQYMDAFISLQASLLDKISNPATLETLATKFHQCFMETIERCTADAQNMPYANRSNKKNEVVRQQQSTAVAVNRAFAPPKSRGLMRRPDSGVVMDDGSEESGSIMGSSSLCHRNSVRTIKGSPQRGGSQIPETVPEVRMAAVLGGNNNDTTTDGYGANHFHDLSMVPSTSMDLSAVQAWSSNVFYPPVNGQAHLHLAGYDGTQTGTITPQPEFLDWHANNFNGMDPEFGGFNGQHQF